MAESSKTQPPTATTTVAVGPITVPRITIQFCTQCKWNLRAAYYAQELLQTFSTSLGEVALLPSTSGTFVIKLYHVKGQSATGNSDQQPESNSGDSLQIQETLIWDRKVNNGFPETKELKNRVRNIIEPGRGLGHTDRALKKAEAAADTTVNAPDQPTSAAQDSTKQTCDDCQ